MQIYFNLIEDISRIGLALYQDMCISRAFDTFFQTELQNLPIFKYSPEYKQCVQVADSLIPQPTLVVRNI